MKTQKAAVQAASYWGQVCSVGFTLGLVYVLASSVVGPIAALVAVGLAGLLPTSVLVLPGAPVGAAVVWLVLVASWR